MNAVAADRPAHVPHELVLDFDFMNLPGHLDDVHVAWKRAVEKAPDIFWTPHNGGHWVAIRADDIEVMQRDHEHFSHEAITIPRAKSARLAPLEYDPPEHTPLRAILSPAFGPKPMQALQPDLRALCIELIDGFYARGECEFVLDFAKRLPIVVFLRLVDLPLEDREHLLELTEMSVRGTAEQRGASYQGLYIYVQKWIAQRREQPGNDLLSKIVNATPGGRAMSPEQTFGMLVNVIFGGLDTVAASLSFVTRWLAENPKACQELIENPALINDALEEFYRRFGIPQTARVITKDFVYKGVPFRKGEQVLVSKTLHGLDERRYPNPLQVDFKRGRVPHAAFGDGPHRCPGSFLARQELRIFLEEWLKRIPQFRLKPDAKVVTSSGMVNGVLSLPLVWDVKPQAGG
jgi:cytochrome P450